MPIDDVGTPRELQLIILGADYDVVIAVAVQVAGSGRYHVRPAICALFTKNCEPLARGQVVQVYVPDPADLSVNDISCSATLVDQIAQRSREEEVFYPVAVDVSGRRNGIAD